ncbi:MAG: metallophosphoesterase family protein [bacterium]
MKIAIIADIHGNIHALEAVLEDIEHQHTDQIVVNGDLVNRGPNNLAVMEKLWGNGNIFILGNHDDLVQMWIARDKKIPDAWFSDPFWDSTATVAEQLHTGGWIETLRKLKMTHEVKLPNAPTLLISHGSPRHYREGYAIYTSECVLSEIVDQYAADIFIGSHTHRPFDQIIQGRRFLNTGAVGAPFNRDPRAQYLLMAYHGKKWQAEFRAIAYDREAAILAFEETDYLEQGTLSAHIFRDELIYSRPLFDPFWRWTRECNKPRIWASWDEFRSINSDKFCGGNRKAKVS